MKLWQWIPLLGRHLSQREYDSEVESSIQAHWKDSPIKISHLICEEWSESVAGEKSNSYNFVVFIDIAGDIDWIANDENAVEKITGQTKALIDCAMAVEALPCKHLAKREWMAFKKMVGASIVAALYKNYDTAQNLIANAQAYLDKRTPERSRLWITISASIAIVVLYLLLPYAKGINTKPLFYGALGSYIAIIYRSGRSQIDASAGLLIHICDTLIKLGAGMIQGKLCILLLSTPFAPEITKSIIISPEAMLAAAFVAGLVDKFVPSLVSSYVVKTLTPKENA